MCPCRVDLLSRVLTMLSDAPAMPIQCNWHTHCILNGPFSTSFKPLSFKWIKCLNDASFESFQCQMALRKYVLYFVILQIVYIEYWNRDADGFCSINRYKLIRQSPVKRWNVPFLFGVHKLGHGNRSGFFGSAVTCIPFVTGSTEKNCRVACEDRKWAELERLQL